MRFLFLFSQFKESLINVNYNPGYVPYSLVEVQCCVASYPRSERPYLL